MASTQTGKSRSSSRKAPPVMARGKPAPTPKTKKISVKSTKPVVGPQEWQSLVATAAYYRAQARGFAGGSAEQDWIDAEAEVATRFARTLLK